MGSESPIGAVLALLFWRIIAVQIPSAVHSRAVASSPLFCVASRFPEGRLIPFHDTGYQPAFEMAPLAAVFGQWIVSVACVLCRFPALCVGGQSPPSARQEQEEGTVT